MILGQERVTVSTLKSRVEFALFVLNRIDYDLVESQKDLLKVLEIDESVGLFELKTGANFTECDLKFLTKETQNFSSHFHRVRVRLFELHEQRHG